jgi:3-demethylubiquinone-9 3-methyltransferase
VGGRPRPPREQGRAGERRPAPARHRRQAGLGEVRRLVDLTQAEVLELERAVEARDAFSRGGQREWCVETCSTRLPTSADETPFHGSSRLSTTQHRDFAEVQTLQHNCTRPTTVHHAFRMSFYTSAFQDSQIVGVARYGVAGPAPKRTVLSATFRPNGQGFIALNGGPRFTFTEAICDVIDMEIWGNAPFRCRGP